MVIFIEKHLVDYFNTGYYIKFGHNISRFSTSLDTHQQSSVSLAYRDRIHWAQQ